MKVEKRMSKSARDAAPTEPGKVVMTGRVKKASKKNASVKVRKQTLRIENDFTNGHGNVEKVKKGERVEVLVEKLRANDKT